MTAPTSFLYILDTNILLAYVRWQALGQYIEATYRLGTLTIPPIISIVSEAEIRVLAAQNGWGHSKMKMLEDTVLNLLTIVPIDSQDLINAYVEIENYSRQQGHIMGKNDLWIAATARVERDHFDY